jgi:ribosome maturation factor RimP
MAQRGRGAAAGSRAGQTRGVKTRTDEAPSRAELLALRDRLRGLADPVVDEVGLDLEELAVTRAGRRFVVRVTVDGDGGVTHDDLSDVARGLSAAFDAAEETGGEITSDAYTLEVSSPGVDRPLTLPRHWRRNVGRLVSVRTGDRTITGRVTATDGASVTFDVDGTQRVAALDELGPGRVQVEFTRLAEADFGDESTEDSDDEFSEDGPMEEEDGT